jgi:hypothetical protein
MVFVIERADSLPRKPDRSVEIRAPDAAWRR